MNDGTIVCGFGHVGSRIVALLNRLGEKVTVIYDEASPEWIGLAEKYGATCLKGNACDEQLLEQAGVRNARAIIAATNSDTANLSIVMDARRLNPGIIAVSRLFDQSLAPHIETALNIRRVLSASSLASPVFTSAALGQNVCGFFTAGGKPYAMHKLHVDPGSKWISMTLDDLPLSAGMKPVLLLSGNRISTPGNAAAAIKEGDTVLAIQDAASRTVAGATTKKKSHGIAKLSLLIRKAWDETSMAIKTVIASLTTLVLAGVIIFHFFLKLSFVDAFYFVITTITTTGYGDYNLSAASTAMKLFGCLLMLSGAVLMATIFSAVTDLVLRTRFREIFNKPTMPGKQHLIVVGMQNIGTRIISELRQAEMDVVVIEESHGEKTGNSALKDIPVITGDPRSEETLIKAGIDDAIALIAVTDDDILNLGTGLQAKKINPQIRTVIRTFDAALGSKLQSHLGIDNVISVSAVSAPMFVGATICRDVIQGIVWQENLVLVQSEGTTPCAQPDMPADATTIIRPSGNGPALKISAFSLKS